MVAAAAAAVVKTAVIIPVVVIILLVLVGFIVVLVWVIKRRGNKSDDWEIDYSELEVGEQLGAGGYPHSPALPRFVSVFSVFPPSWVCNQDGGWGVGWRQLR